MKECYHLAFGKTAIDDRDGNASLAALGVFAYQVLHVIRTTALTGAWRTAQPATLRAWLFRLPAKIPPMRARPSSGSSALNRSVRLCSARCASWATSPHLAPPASHSSERLSDALPPSRRSPGGCVAASLRLAHSRVCQPPGTPHWRPGRSTRTSRSLSHSRTSTSADPRHQRAHSQPQLRDPGSSHRPRAPTRRQHYSQGMHSRQTR